MVYAVAMKTIEHFERALGRPVLWRPQTNPSNEFDDSQFVRRLVISPHAPRSGRRFAILSGERLEGSLIEFGAPEAEVDLPNDEALANAIADEAHARHVETWRPDYRRLDYAEAELVWSPG